MTETPLDLLTEIDTDLNLDGLDGIQAVSDGVRTQAQAMAAEGEATTAPAADAAAEATATSDIPEGFVLVDGVLIPESAFEGEIEEIEAEAGPDVATPRSGGGSDDSYTLGDIGEGIDITALLPPTALAFDTVKDEDLFPFVDDNDVPTISVIAIDRDTGEIEIVPNATDVSEGGLLGGSTAGDGSDTATGTITVDTGEDALGSLVINGVDVTQGGTVEGEFGTLTVTVTEDGTFAFDYVVTEPVDHPDAGSVGTSEGIAEDFEIVATDEDGDTSTSTLVIDVLDDGPIARDDTGDVDGTLTTLSGNLADNDASGADGPADTGFVAGAAIGDMVVPVGEATDAGLGTLTIGPDGDYVFDLDTDNPDYGVLTDAETATVVVDYTVEDGDGDTASATLTLTIRGEDDPVTLGGLGGDAPDVAVDESNLADGSSPDGDALTQGGEFTVDTPDGLASITVGGVALLGEDGFVGPVSIATQYGTLTVTDFTPDTTPGGVVVGGTFTYAFELSDPTDDHDGPGPDVVSEAVPVVAIDRDGDSATGTVDIAVADDAPDAVDDGPIAVTEGSDAVLGTLVANDTEGADGATLTAFTYGGETFGAGDTVVTQSGGELTVNADGTYSYLPGSSVDNGVEESFTYTLTDADGDSDTATVTLVHEGDVNTPDAGGASATLDEDDLEGGLGDMAAGDNAAAGLSGRLGVDFGEDGAGTIAFVETDPLDIGGTLYDVSVAEDGLTLTLSTNGQDVLVATLAEPTSDAYTVTLLQPLDHAGTTPGFEDDLEIALGYVVTDSDGSTAGGTLALTIDDDIPVAAPVSAEQSEENAPVRIDITDGFAAGADGVDLADGVTGTLVEGDGSLVYNGDGTFTYLPADGEDGPVSFTYTVTDSEGDTATATATITLQPDSVPGLAVTGGSVVDEAGLPGGSSAGNGSDATSGIISPDTQADGIGSLVINGVDVTTGGTVTGAFGTLTVTANDDGSYAYDYGLAAPTDHPVRGESGTAEGLTDTFEIVLTDTDGDTAQSALAIDVLDDGPSAQDDMADVGEDGPFTAEGDLLGNDTPGADGGTITQVEFGSDAFQPGDTIATDFGTLLVQPDGTYTYSLDTDDPATVAQVQALGEGQTLTEVVTYTLTDGDGDPVTADLVITITGEDDIVTLGGLDPDMVEITVDEDDLSTGSSPDANALTQGNSFSVDAPDGLDAVTLGGVALFEDGTFAGVGTSVETPLGVVVITGFTADTAPDGTVVGGTFTYAYTLQTNALETGEGENAASETLALIAIDVDGDTASGSVDIAIVDDVPMAENDGPVAVTEGGADPDSAAVSGSVLSNDVAGADGATVALIGSADTPFGTLELLADGTYTYTPNASVPADTVDSFTYQITDADGDTDTATLTFAYRGDVNSPEATGGRAVVDEDDLPGGVGDMADGDDDPSATGVLGADFGLDGAGTVLFGDTADITIDGETYAFTTSADGLTVTVSDGTQDVLRVDLADSTSGAYTVTLLAPLSHGEAGTEDNIPFAVGYAVTDADGSVANGTLLVSVDDDLPVAESVSALQGVEDQPVTVDVLSAVQGGADGFDAAAISAVLTRGAGTLTDNGDGTFTYGPASGETGTVTFDYTVVDGDGDTATATVTIALAGDSEPTITLGDPVVVDEDGFGTANVDTVPPATNETDSTESTTATGTFGVFYGNDVPADLLAAFGFSVETADLAALNAQGLSTADGSLVWSVSADGRTLTGNDGTQDAVTVTVNAASETGPGMVEYSYDVSLLVPLAHPGTSVEDVVNLVGIAFVVTDSDGDTAEASFGIGIVDDVPTAADDSFGAQEAGTLNPVPITEGNVLGNDQIGADDDGAFVTLQSPATGSFGTLTLGTDGQFTYVPNGSVDAGEADVFTYTLTDGDGDVSTATLTLTFSGDNNAPLSDTSVATLDDDGLDDGDQTVGNPASGGADDLDANVDDLDGPASSEASFTGRLGTSYGGDGPGSADFANLDGGTAMVGLEMVSFAWDGALEILTATITGGARDGVDLFVVTLTESATPGDYGFTVELLDNVLHPMGPNGEQDDVVLDLAYRTVDSDGSVQVGNVLTLTFDDDAPSAVDGTATQTVEDGNVLVDAVSLITAGADGVALSDIQASLDGAPGVLTANGDGTFTYDPVPGQTGTVRVNVTATDGDGDIVDAVVQITLLADSPAVLEILGSTVVAEAGLDVSSGNPLGGSDAASDSETTSGTFSIDTGNDSVATLVVGGTDVTGGGTVSGDYGDLVVTLDSGAYSWTYTLRDNTLDHDGADDTGADDTVFDAFVVDVTDSDGSTDSDTLTITVEDDGPTAENDSNSVTEDAAANTASGNVILENDVQGADGAEITDLDYDGSALVVGSLNTVEYGTIIVDADGGYIYALDNSDPAVQALGVGDTLTEVFTYTLVDGENADGDSATATLTITIVGADDGVTINGVDPNAPEITVDEDDLADGSSPDMAALTQGNSFGVEAPDGLDTVTIEGVVVYENGALTGNAVNTPLGVLIVTGFTPDALAGGEVVGGTFAYTYTLQTNDDHDAGNGEAPSAETLDLVVSDTDGSLASAELDVSIIDDIAAAENDGASVTEDGPLLAEGNVVTENDTPGADGASVTAISFGGASQTLGEGFDTSYGELTLEADGGYSYALDNTNADVQALGEGETLLETVIYTLTDGDGDADTAELVITIVGTDDGVIIRGLDPDAAELMVDEDDLAGGSSPDMAALTQGDSFEVEAADGLGTVTLGGTTLFENGSFIGPVTLDTPQGELQVTGFTAVTSPNGTVIGGTFDYQYTLTDAGAHPNADGQNINTESLSLTVTDVDNDSASGTIDIAIVDDVPDATDDGPVTVREGDAPLDGTVATNDIEGADGASFSLVSSATGSHGTLVLDADGTYTYTPDASVAAGQTDAFTYQITDADGDTDTAILTFAFQGDANSASAATVSVVVDEDGLGDANTDGMPLRAGETDATESATATGSGLFDFGLDGPGGFTWDGDGTTLTVDGVVYDLAVSADGLTATLSDNGRDVLEVQITDVATGAYRVTLLDDMAHDGTPADTENALLVSLGYSVTDSDGPSVSGTVNVSVADDIPVLASAEAGGEAITVANTDGATAGGLFETFGFGADDVGGVTIDHTPPDGVVLGDVVDNGDGTYTVTGFAETAAGGQGDALYSFTVDSADGGYDFLLIEAEGATTEVVNLDNVEPGNGAFTELSNGQIEFENQDPNGTVNVSTVGFAPNNQFFESGQAVRLEFFEEGSTLGNDDPNVSSTNDFITSVSFDVDAQGSPNAIDTVRVSYTAINTETGDTVTGIVDATRGGNVDPSEDGQITIDPGIAFNVLILSNTVSGADFRLNSPELGRTILPQDAVLEFGVAIVDGDGDTAGVETVTVDIDASGASAALVAGAFDPKTRADAEGFDAGPVDLDDVRVEFLSRQSDRGEDALQAGLIMAGLGALAESAAAAEAVFVPDMAVPSFSTAQVAEPLETTGLDALEAMTPSVPDTDTVSETVDVIFDTAVDARIWDGGLAPLAEAMDVALPVFQADDGFAFDDFAALPDLSDMLDVQVDLGALLDAALAVDAEAADATQDLDAETANADPTVSAFAPDPTGIPDAAGLPDVHMDDFAELAAAAAVMGF